MLQALNVLNVDRLTNQEKTQPIDSLQNRILAALEHARRVTAMYEKDHIEIALAWEVLEELTKAQRHHQSKKMTNFELYCLMNPDAPECRIYDL